MAHAPDPLSSLLGADVPASVGALPEAVLARLADQISTAQAHQRTVIEESVRTAVNGVPLPVRGIVRKALL